MKLFLLFILTIATCSVSMTPASNRSEPDDLDSVLEPIRQKYNVPGMAGAILTSSGLQELGAVGVRKAGTDVRVTDNDQWHLGSDTKAMTATLIAHLVERGKLRWDSTIGEVFPVLAKSMNPQMRNVTLLELLSHRAGLPHDLPWRKLSSEGSLMEQRRAAVKMATSVPPEYQPGSKFEYSNLGFVIAAAMAERVENRPWEEMIRQVVFEPLHMTSVGFGGTGTPGKIDEPWPHFANGKPAPSNGPAMDNPEVMGAAGTVHCSIADWAKFVADQLRGDRGEGALLKPSSYERLHTPPFGGDYALGWGVVDRPWGGGTVLTHAGSNTMNYAVVWLAPKRNFAVLVCTNQGGDTAAKACDEAASALIMRHLKKNK